MDPYLIGLLGLILLLVLLALGRFRVNQYSFSNARIVW